MADVVTTTKAGFWVRVVATIIDWVILAVIGFVLQNILGGLSGIVSFVVNVAYLVYFWSTTGQTIGHKVMGLRVVRTDGSSLDMSRAVIRYVGMIVAAIPLGLGFLWVALDDRKQGWHDKIADTCVVKV